MKTTVKLPFKKETANMLQYQPEDKTLKKDLTVPTLYIRKTVFDQPWPKFIKVTIEGTNR